MTSPELPPTLIDKVYAEAIDCRSPDDLANGLERLLGVELAPDEIEYLEESWPAGSYRGS
jgi:hypothetical protein